ncbi:MAG: hypothetical protein E7133_05475 [Rikenellaceae bacterium]|nr:hypothetical protein [Rikenellaceae bacterium]
MNRPELQGLGLPERCTLPTESSDKEDDCVRVLRDELGGMAERKLLYTKLVNVLGITDSYARTKVARSISKGVILCNDNSIVTLP